MRFSTEWTERIMRSQLSPTAKQQAVMMADFLPIFFDVSDVEELLERHRRSIYRLLNDLDREGFVAKRIGLEGEASIYTFKLPD